MPRMIPPHYPVTYNATRLRSGELDVLVRDVEVLKRVGWKLAAKTKKPTRSPREPEE